MFFGVKLYRRIFTNAVLLFVSLEALPASNHINKSGVDKERGHNESFSSILLCADGKGPLLEGEGNVLPCAGECPQGFDCELFSSGDRTGICCPNVTELFKLYSTESSSDSLPEVLEASGFTMESRDEGAAYTQRQELHPDKAALSLIQASRTDIRQRPLGHRPVGSVQTPAASQLDSESFSCKRQTLQLYCEDGHRQTQFVLRWYHREGACLSYPWGYCPGQPVASDVTLRTKEECELLCLVHNMPQQQQQHQKEDKMVGPPLTSREFDSVERETGPFDLSSPESIRLIAGNEGHKQVKAAQQTETNVLRFDHRSGFSSGLSEDLSPPTYLVEEDQSGNLVNKVLKVKFPMRPAKGRYSLAHYLRNRSKALGYSVSPPTYRVEEDENGNLVNKDLKEIEQMLMPTQFLLYYLRPEAILSIDDIPLSEPLTIAYRASDYKVAHYKVRYFSTKSGEKMWSVDMGEPIPKQPSFFSLDKLIQYYKVFCCFFGRWLC